MKKQISPPMVVEGEVRRKSNRAKRGVLEGGARGEEVGNCTAETDGEVGPALEGPTVPNSFSSRTGKRRTLPAARGESPLGFYGQPRAACAVHAMLSGGGPAYPSARLLRRLIIT